MHMMHVLFLLSLFSGASLAQLADDVLLKALVPTDRLNVSRWAKLNLKYVADMEANRERGLDLLIYGDSVTESLRGTGLGRPTKQFNQNKRAWDTLVVSKYRALIASIAADTSMHVLWRLQNGGGPQGLDVKVVMVMCGNNDFLKNVKQYPGDVESVVRSSVLGVQLVLEELAAQAPAAKLVLLGLTPYTPFWDGRWQLLVDKTNEQLQRFAAGTQQGGGRSIGFVDCSPPFFFEEGGVRKVNSTLIRDGMHPSRQGGWLLAECLLQAFLDATKQ